MRNRLGRGPAVMTFLAVELLSSQVGAGASLSGWQLIGPPGGSVEVFATDPKQPAVIYAGGRDGICRSRDAGQSWTPINNGLTHRGVISIAIDPSDSSRLYAGTWNGLFKSEDGGNHWLDSNERLPRAGRRRWMSVWSIVVHPNRPLTILIGVETSQGATPQPDFAGGVFKSVDGGRTNTGVSQVVSLRSPGYRVMRGGVLWSRSPTGWSIRGTLAEKICMGFVVHVTSDPRRLYSDGCGSLKSEDGGSSWRHVGTPGLRPQSLLVDGKRHSRLWIRSATELRRSDDGGKTWRSLDLPATGAIEAFSPASGTESALIAVADAGLQTAASPGATSREICGPKWPQSNSIRPRAKSSSRELRVWQLFG